MPPAARNTRKATDKPKVTGLNLDSLAREGRKDGPAEPYVTVLGGRPYTFQDPMDQDWQDQVRVDPNNAVAILRSLLSEEDWEQFRQHRMKSWMLVRLVKDIRDYYGTDEEEGNDFASPTS